MTGRDAEGKAEVGASFSAWDSYIWGENKALEPHSKIVQTWRTSEFTEEDEDSILEIHFKEVENGTELTIKHTNIPEGQSQYQKGWDDHYIIPMREHFNK
ncbi:MAG: SRPBCC domain-containing protein [Crocinitomicaceae bacterium]|nr:SRPBCC domain-containing protein [Crocinitomicaceae bacterium]